MRCTDLKNVVIIVILLVKKQHQIRRKQITFYYDCKFHEKLKPIKHHTYDSMSVYTLSNIKKNIQYLDNAALPYLTSFTVRNLKRVISIQVISICAEMDSEMTQN